MKVIVTETELFDAVRAYLEEQYPGMLIDWVQLDHRNDDDGFVEYRAKAELYEDPDAI